MKTFLKVQVMPDEPVLLPVGSQIVHVEVEGSGLLFYIDHLDVMEESWSQDHERLFTVESLDRIAAGESSYPHYGRLLWTIPVAHLGFWEWFCALVLRGRRPDVMGVFELPLPKNGG